MTGANVSYKGGGGRGERREERGGMDGDGAGERSWN